MACVLYYDGFCARIRALYLTVFHVYDSVAGLCQVGVVGHNDKGLTKLIAQGTEEALEFVGIVGVEVARGFVGKHHIGVVDKSSGYGRTLFLAAAEFRWFVLGTVAKCEEVQQFGGPFVGLGFARPPMRAGIITFSMAVNSGSS